MTSEDVVRRFVQARLARNTAKDARDACLCERHSESRTLFDFNAAGEFVCQPPAIQEEPCWKAARKRTEVTPWDDGGKFYLDPPMSEWCETCRRRQGLAAEYTRAVRAHAGALRGLIRHGRTLLKA